MDQKNVMKNNNRRLQFSRELVGDSVERIVEEGVQSEKLGFDMIFVPDHLVDIKPLLAVFDCWTTLGYIGAKTTKLRLGSGVTDIQRIHPAKTANIVSTLDNLTKGRAVLGIGTGEIMNTRPFGIPWEDKKDRLKRLKETIEVIKLLWLSSYEKPVSYDGEFLKLDRAHLSIPPIQNPRPPIYIGSFSSKSTLRMVGEVADGWYPASQFTPQAFQENVRLIHEACRSANRSIESLDIIANVPTFVCEDEEKERELKKRIKLGLKRKIIINQYLFKIFDIDKSKTQEYLPKDLEYQFASPGPDYDERLNKSLDKLPIPDDYLEKAISTTVAIGSADDCLSTIEKYVQAGATNIFFGSLLASEENYRNISEKIIPILKSS